MRILVVDMEILIAMEAVQILEEALGCTGVAATWMNVAIHGEGLRFDIVIADSDVQAETLGLLDIMEATRGAARIFMTTGDLRNVMFSGIGPVLNKPFLPAALLDAVARTKVT